MGVGARLRDARERQGVTLRQVADTTKMSRSTLEAIERDDLDRLPGGIITKGYLRAFAGAVGQDPEEIVRQYVAQYPLATTAPDFRRGQAPDLDDSHPRRDLLTLLSAVGLAYLLYSGVQTPAHAPLLLPESPGVLLDSASSFPHESLDDSASSLPEENVNTASPAVAGVAVPVVDAISRAVHLEIAPTGPCWVSATADGERVVYRLVDRGERVTVTADQEVVLRVGEPGAFAYSVNGAAGRPIGELGQPITVTITDQNYETFQNGAVTLLSGNDVT